MVAEATSDNRVKDIHDAYCALHRLPKQTLAQVVGGYLSKQKEAQDWYCYQCDPETGHEFLTDNGTKEQILKRMQSRYDGGLDVWAIGPNGQKVLPYDRQDKITVSLTVGEVQRLKTSRIAVAALANKFTNQLEITPTENGYYMARFRVSDDLAFFPVKFIRRDTGDLVRCAELSGDTLASKFIFRDGIPIT